MNASRHVKTDLTEYLRELHLPAIRTCFEEKARQAERETLSYEQYLLDLAERECQERRENRITRLLRDSKLPLEKTLENFDLKRLPPKAARQVKALLDGAFLDRKENVLAFGNPDLLEPSVLKVGSHFQRSDDDGGRDRPARAPQRDPRTEHL
jgi:DNA replication protein DnaC